MSSRSSMISPPHFFFSLLMEGGDKQFKMDWNTMRLFSKFDLLTHLPQGSLFLALPCSASSCATQTMAARHRASAHPLTLKPLPLKGGDSSIQLPTFSASMHDGSKLKPYRFRYGATIALSQAILLATASASLAAVVTAFGASRFLVNRFDVNTDSAMTTMLHATSPRIVEDDLEVITTNRKLSSFGKVSNSIEDDSTSLFEGRIQEPAFLRDLDEAGEADNVQPTPVWLMSFPNSGTSFTIHLTRESSNTTTATNYALEGDIKDQFPPPVVNTSENGPFLELIRDRHTNIPKYILTKTHCGGFCSDCPPQWYIETPRSFQTQCQTGRRAIKTDRGFRTKLVTYNASLVKKAIHVIRHPLDNIVARFHLMYKRFEEEKPDPAWLAKYPYNSIGFNKWCADQDKMFHLSQYRWVDQTLADTFASVPCHQEFFRYVQWHNLAFTVSRDMGLPTLIIYYHDYSEDLETATKRLLAFLELPRVSEGIEFSHGKEYRDYYSAEQRAAVKAMIKEQSTAETWHYLKAYDFS